MTVAKSTQKRELHNLNAIAEALATASDARQALERTLALVADRLELRTGWVWLYGSEAKQFYNAASPGGCMSLFLRPTMDGEERVRRVLQAVALAIQRGLI